MSVHLPKLIALLVLLPGCSEPQWGEAAAAQALGETAKPPSWTTSSPKPTPRTYAYYVALEGRPAVDDFLRLRDSSRAEALEASRGRIAEIEGAQAVLEPRLEALGARVTGRFSRLTNALQVQASPEASRAFERLPGVLRVERVPTYHPSNATAAELVRAHAVWQSATSRTGRGVTIGILDTGIDYLHAHFGGAGDGAAFLADDETQVEPGSFPTAKVIGGRDFVGNDYNADGSGGAEIPKPDEDPIDCNGHGTHVAGIAAGVGVTSDGEPFTGSYAQSFDPQALSIGPGMAPEAKLVALKAFGCSGSTNALGTALEWAVDPDGDGDFSDRLDIINASLGTSYSLGSSTEAEIVRRLDAIGTVFIAAVGNDGGEGRPFFTVSSPSSYPEALAVGATLNGGQEFQGLAVDAPAALEGILLSAEGAFTAPLSDTGPTSGELVLVDPPLACADLVNASALQGAVALVDRGDCAFFDKLERVEAAGAIAAIVVDHTETDLPLVMGSDVGEVGIPGVLIRKVDGDELKASLAAGVRVTLDSDVTFPEQLGPDYVAQFSSRGPDSAAGRVKPELAAPGQPIISAAVGTGDQAASLGGTSMASPVVAGVAGLLLEAQPDLEPHQVRAALMNSGQPVTDLGGHPFPATLAGAGRVDAERAVATSIIAHAPGANLGVGFDAIVAAETAQHTRTLLVENVSSEPQQVAARIRESRALFGVAAYVEPAELSLAAGERATIELTLELSPQLLPAPRWDSVSASALRGTPRHFLVEAGGVVELSASSGAAVAVPYQASVRAASRREAGEFSGCAAGSEGGGLQLTLMGSSAHPQPLVGVFERGPAEALGEGIRQVGVASDLGSVGDLDAGFLFFAVQLEEEVRTLARGPLSALAVYLDTDLDDAAEHVVFVEPFTPSRPNANYGDVLTATTLEVETGNRTSVPLSFALPTNLLDTTYYTDVAILPVPLSILGLQGDPIEIAYGVGRGYPSAPTAFSFSRFRPGRAAVGLTPVAATSPRLPLLDGGPVDLVARLRDDGPPPQLLLVYPTNEPGLRTQVVSLPEPDAPGFISGNLNLRAEAPDEVQLGRAFEIGLEIVNDGEQDHRGSRLVAALPATTKVDQLVPSRGSCSPNPPSCELGDLAVGERVTVRAVARAVEVAEIDGVEDQLLDLGFQLSSEEGCERSLTDNVVQLRLPLANTPSNGAMAGVGLQPSGGCACRAGKLPGSGALSSAFGLGLLGFLGARRWSRRRPQR